MERSVRSRRDIIIYKFKKKKIGYQFKTKQNISPKKLNAVCNYYFVVKLFIIIINSSDFTEQYGDPGDKAQGNDYSNGLDMRPMDRNRRTHKAGSRVKIDSEKAYWTRDGAKDRGKIGPGEIDKGKCPIGRSGKQIVGGG